MRVFVFFFPYALIILLIMILLFNFKVLIVQRKLLDDLAITRFCWFWIEILVRNFRFVSDSSLCVNA